jgi:hypothetical protein
MRRHYTTTICFFLSVTIFLQGRFYFGEMLPEEECNEEISAMHASLAEVAAAKARMFVNKPDGSSGP